MPSRTKQKNAEITARSAAEDTQGGHYPIGAETITGEEVIAATQTFKA